MMRRKDNAMKIVLEGAPGNETERRTATLRNAYPAAEFVVASTGEEQIEQIRDADAYYGWPAREVFVAAERLRWVHCPGTGIDQITKIPELIESDVVVTNTKGPHVAPMADHVMGMIVMLAHRWRELMEDQRLHRWETGKYHNTYLQLEGSTIGILAVGDIGAAVARRANGFGMNIYAVDVQPRNLPEVREVWGPDRLDDLLAMSDWFVVTAPLTPATRNLIDARRLGLMKESSRLIVISRGGIVNEGALVGALQSGTIAGAALDAFEPEPLASDSPLWDMDNVIITPHASAYTTDLLTGRWQVYVDFLECFMTGRPFPYVCDKSAGY
jgi:phosphoglycerate dehydrogenase-like enzyme